VTAHEDTMHENICRPERFLTKQLHHLLQVRGMSQQHNRPDCDLHIIRDVTGNNGCILGVPDFQPRRAAPKSARQGPSGTCE